MKKIILASLGMAMIFISCEKVKNQTTTPNNTAANNTTPSPMPSGGDGAIVAVQSVSKSTVGGFPITTTLGTAVAVFGNLAASTYSDAGAITLNSKTLTKQSNNSYVFAPTATDITGIDLSGALNWSIGGGAAVGAFTHDASAQGMPVADDISGSYTSVNSGSNFTLSTVSSISNSDSVYFQLSGPNSTVLKRVAANTSSVTFTAAEVQSVGKGSGVVTIAPWNWTVKSLGGKQINVVNEVALTRIVTID